MQELIQKYISAASPLAVFFAVIAGVVTSFSSCIFPLIPIIASYLGSRGEPSKFHNFLLAVFYVIGMSIVYTALGIMAALTGKMFGNVPSHPLVNLMVGNILILLGLSLLDVFKLPIPGFGTGAGTGKGHGILGILFLGMISGFVAAPCTAGVFQTIIDFIAQTKDVLFGGAVMFSYTIGLGFLLVVIGTVTGILSNLPKGGNWTAVIRKVFAFVMIATGEYFLIKAGLLWGVDTSSKLPT
ncbi:MAG: cytochrome c biogenesis protein CcdA [Planctomycetota bacterium]